MRESIQNEKTANGHPAGAARLAPLPTSDASHPTGMSTTDNLRLAFYRRYPEASKRVTWRAAELHPLIRTKGPGVVLAMLTEALLIEGFRTADGHPFDRNEIPLLLKWGRR